MKLLIVRIIVLTGLGWVAYQVLKAVWVSLTDVGVSLSLRIGLMCIVVIGSIGLAFYEEYRDKKKKQEFDDFLSD